MAPDADAEKIRALAKQWRIACELAIKLHCLAGALPFDIVIFSGYRTAEEQKNAGPTAAPDELSTHRSDPATGADVKPTIAVDDSVKIRFGHAAEALGLRWGGGAQRKNGIPVGVEWMHLDMGPRRLTSRTL